MTNFTDFIDASPSPYHVTRALRLRLEAAGYRYLAEGADWSLEPLKGYYTQRGGKTLVAWKCGSLPAAERGLRILAAHTDSPCLKIKANPLIVAAKSRLLSVDIYGSPLLYTWLDRDLKLSGIVYSTADDPYTVKPHLVDLAETPLRAPSLAIHLNRDIKEKGLTINPQTQLNLLFAGTHADEAIDLAGLLARKLAVKPEHIAGYDLRAADMQPSGTLGVNAEFISGPRLDNLFSCFCIQEALLARTSEASEHTLMAAWFDAEEIGSQTVGGARSNFLDTVLLRIVLAEKGTGFEDFHRAKARSVMLSADMAHAEHPAFKDKTDENHVPMLNGGLALKSSAGANYGNSSELAAWLTSACRSHAIPLQYFTYRCDHGSGSSVGPMVSSLTGIRTIDVGAPMLSMHSIRELAGHDDLALSQRAFEVFYREPIGFQEEPDAIDRLL